MQYLYSGILVLCSNCTAVFVLAGLTNKYCFDYNLLYNKDVDDNNIYSIWYLKVADFLLENKLVSLLRQQACPTSESLIAAMISNIIEAIAKSIATLN